MAATHDATQVVLSPQRPVRRILTPIVAILAAFVVGMTIGNVINDDDAATRSTVVGARTESALDAPWAGARGLGQATGNPAAHAAAAARLTALAAAYRDGILDGINAAGNPVVTSQELSDIWQLRRLDIVSGATGVSAVQTAEGAGLTGPTGHHETDEPFSPELIWAKRTGGGWPSPAETSAPALDRPHGMQ